MSPQEIFKVVGINIRGFRLEAGLTQEELCHYVGISNTYLSRLENGSNEPSMHLLIEIANITGHSLSEYFVPPPRRFTLDGVTLMMLNDGGRTSPRPSTY